MPKFKTIGIQLGLFTASALMLTFIQVPHKLHFLAWVALVPFVLACRGESKTFALIAVSFFVSTACWLVNLSISIFSGCITIPGSRISVCGFTGYIRQYGWYYWNHCWSGIFLIALFRGIDLNHLTT